MKDEHNRLNSQRLQATHRVLRLFGFSLLLVIACGGCSQVANAPADINPVGTYTLVSVDGNKVPCTLKHEGITMSIGSGAFTINADGVCMSKMTVKVPPNAAESTVDAKATYTRQDLKLTMKWEKAGTTTGIIRGNTFTMVNEGMTFVYQK